MAQILKFPIGRERLYATLSGYEREFVESVLHLFPDYSYELSGLPKLNPPPAPGVASAVAAAKTIIALIREGGFDIGSTECAINHSSVVSSVPASSMLVVDRKRGPISNIS